MPEIVKNNGHWMNNSYAKRVDWEYAGYNNAMQKHRKSFRTINSNIDTRNAQTLMSSISVVSIPYKTGDSIVSIYREDDGVLLHQFIIPTVQSKHVIYPVLLTPLY